MILFDQTTCISICLKNKNPYVALAAEDLRKDFNRVSESRLMPQYTEDVCGGCIVIEENDARVIDPIEDESFSIRTEGDVIFISASTASWLSTFAIASRTSDSAVSFLQETSITLKTSASAMIIDNNFFIMSP